MSEQLVLPPQLRALQSPVGVHRRGMKGIIFGTDKGGKSYFLAHMPKPRVMLDCGEGGIQQYLEKDDICLTIESADSYVAAMDFLKANQHKIASVGIDPITALYQDWMDDWSEKFGGDIQGSDWKSVKPPWKLHLRTLMRAPFHCFFAAHLRDTGFFGEQDETDKKKTKLKIKPIEMANAEKTVPYTVDLTLRAENVTDAKLRPTTTHSIRVWKARIPLNMVGELYIGREWRFDSRERPNPWDIVIAPLLDKWSMGAVDHLGIHDPAEFEAVRAELEGMGSTYSLGEVMKMLDTCPAKNLAEYQDWWADNIAPHVGVLDEAAAGVYKKAHEAKKKALAEKEKN